jgi:hypothetical protein
MSWKGATAGRQATVYGGLSIKKPGFQSQTCGSTHLMSV